MRHEFEGEQHAAHADAADAEDPDPAQPGDEEQADPNERDEHGLTEVRLQDERDDRRRQQQQRNQIAGETVAAALGKGPGGEDDKAGLHEFRRLNTENPAPGAFHLLAEQKRGENQRHRDEKYDQRGAPHVPRRQQRGGEEYGERGDEEHHLFVDEVEGRQAEPFGNRGACRHGQDETENDQRAERGDQPTVDRPPPLCQGRAFDARDHDLPPLDHDVGSWTLKPDLPDLNNPKS